MQKFFFDMKDGVPMRDRIGIEFPGNAEAIVHCKELAQHIRDGSLRDDKELEIAVVNSVGREIHREFVHGNNGVFERLQLANMRYRSIDFDVEEVSPEQWRWKIYASEFSPAITGNAQYMSREAAVSGCVQKIDSLKPSR